MFKITVVPSKSRNPTLSPQPVAALICGPHSFMLSMQELIDLEGACTAIRLNLEVGDQPKQTQAESPKFTGKVRTNTVAVREFFDRIGINFEGEIAALVREHAPVQSVNGHVGHVAIQGTQYELTTNGTNQATDTDYVPVSPEEIGTLVDRITQNANRGKPRSAARIACRVLEECVEMCLAAGTTPQAILSGVADSLHNQALKASATGGPTVFPSQIQTPHDRTELTGEIADVHLVLADLMYVSGISTRDVLAAERRKFEKLSSPDAQFATDADGHTFYMRKPHVKDNTPST